MQGLGSLLTGRRVGVMISDRWIRGHIVAMLHQLKAKVVAAPANQTGLKLLACFTPEAVVGDLDEASAENREKLVVELIGPQRPPVLLVSDRRESLGGIHAVRWLAKPPSTEELVRELVRVLPRVSVS